MQLLHGKAAAVVQCVQTSLCNHEDILKWRLEFLFGVYTAYCHGMWCCSAEQTGIAVCGIAPCKGIMQVWDWCLDNSFLAGPMSWALCIDNVSPGC